MILQNCVLILGAGASAPYNFPLGEDFKGRILSVTVSGQWEHVMNAFKKQFSLSDLPSVDRFLDECKKRPDGEPYPNEQIITMGKLAIARVLLPCEIPQSQVSGWYGNLTDALVKGYSPEIAKRLTIITFNYDRSLEYYLLRSLKAIYGSRKFDGERLRNLVEILHVYGQLGELPHLKEGEDTVNYGEEVRVDEAVKGIRVIGERAESAQLKLIQDRIKTADALAFIGFGFHDENVALLLNAYAPTDRTIPIFASAFDLGIGKKAMLRIKYPNYKWVFGAPGADARRFLHDTDLFSAITSDVPNALVTLANELH